MLVYQLGTALQFNADMFILNKTLGREIQGSYGLLLTWCGILRGMLGSLGQLLAGSLAAFQAGDEHERVAELAMKGVRILGMMIAIVVGVLCGLAGPALNWWLGADFVYLAPLAWLILAPLVLEGSFNPAMVVIYAPETIALPAKAAVVLGVINVVLGLCLVKFTGMGMYGVGLALATTSVIRHGVVFPIYAARVMRKPWYFLIQQQSQIIVQLGITGVLALYASQFLHTRSLLQLALAALAAGGVATLIALVQLNQDERARLVSLVRRR